MNVNKEVLNETKSIKAKIAVYIFIALTLLRFIAEAIPPLWFLLLIAYTVVPFIITRNNKKEIGLQKIVSKRYLLLGIFLAIAVKALTIYWLFATFGYHQSNWMMSITTHFHELPSMPTVAIVFTMIFSVGVPLAEELFFRLFQRIWSRKYSSCNAMIISAALFGLSHIDQYVFDFNLLGIVTRFIPITIYGLVHAWVFSKTKSTYSSMITHIIGNAFEAIILIFVIIPRVF